MDVSKNRGKTTKMDGFLIEHPIKMDDLGVFPYFWKHPYNLYKISPDFHWVFGRPNFAPKKVQVSPNFSPAEPPTEPQVYQSDPCGVRAAKVGLDGQGSITIEWRDRPPEELLLAPYK